jgi:hypothetical protein
MNTPLKLLAGLGVLALGACTGTSEPLNPVLLVTGLEGAAGPQVALIRDSFGTTGASDERLTFLSESTRPLPAPAVSYDVVDREGTRGALVVLSRADPVAGAATGYLNFFALSGIDPNDPAAFTETRQLSLEPGEVEFVDTVIDPRFCPSGVQVTQTGNFAAVLSEPRLCGSNQNPFIDILDLEGEQVRVLERLSNVAGGGIYLGQGAALDLLYYAVNAPNSLLLRRAVMPRPGSGSSFDQNDLIVQDVTAVTANTARQGNFVDLGRAGAPGNERLVVLFERALVNVTNFSGEGVAGEPIATERNNAQVIRNDRRDTDATFFLSTPEAQRFSFLPPAGGAEQLQNASVRATDAVVEPTYDFIYFVADGVVSLFDLRSFRAGTDLPDPRPLPVEELLAPSFVTWAQSVPLIP